jgi:hypothetical protein
VQLREIHAGGISPVFVSAAVPFTLERLQAAVPFTPERLQRGNSSKSLFFERDLPD